MADDKIIYQGAMAGYQSALIEQQNAYAQARIADDAAAQTEAAMNMADIRARMNEFNRMASESMPQRREQLPPGRYLSDENIERARLYMTPEQREVAHAATSHGTKEERERAYVENMAKLQRMRASGEYRQTTEQNG